MAAVANAISVVPSPLGTGGTTDAASSTAKPRRHTSRNHHPLVWVCAAVALGIAVDAFVPLSFGIWFWLAIVSLAAWQLTLRRGRTGVSSLIMLASVAAWAGGWNHLHWHLFAANDLAHFAGEDDAPVALRVRALEAPRRLPAPRFDPLRAIPSGERSRLEIEAVELRQGDTWRPVSGRAVMIVDGHLLGVQAGDLLEVFARVRRTLPAGNPGEMDFAEHARADRITCSLRCNYPDCVTVLARGGWSEQRLYDQMRAYGDQRLWHRLGGSHSGLAAALLLGSREQLDFGRTEAFFHTNTIHFLAISGLHVGILAGSLLFLWRKGVVSRRWALLVVAGAACLYATMTGGEPSAARAATLVVLLCLSLAVQRPTLAFNCLAAAALFILWRNPADLFRTGPQLSFLAVGAIAWFGPHWLRWQEQDALDRLIAQHRRWPTRAALWLGRWWFRATLVTAVVWAVTLPLIMLRFHLVSPVAILLSPLLTLPIGVALLSGFALLLFGWLSPTLDDFLAMLCRGSLQSIDAIVGWGSQLPGNHYWVAGPQPWLVALFYAGLLAWAAWPLRQGKRRFGGMLLGVWGVLWLGPLAWPHSPPQRLECTFLSMGHGCAVVVHLPDGSTLLYDAGRLGSPPGGARSVASYLWSRGITRIDALVISHADVDHYNAVPQLLRQFNVGSVYLSPAMWRKSGGDGFGQSPPTADDSAALGVLRTAIEAAGVPLKQVWDEQNPLLQPFDVAIECLHPPEAGVAGSDNANSVVLKIEFQGRRILLTGDLEAAGLMRLLATESLPYDVALAPHHGSARSDPPGFAAWSRPRAVIVSGGFDRTDAEVVEAFEAHGSQVLHTARHGAVTVLVQDGHLTVDWFRRER